MPRKRRRRHSLYVRWAVALCLLAPEVSAGQRDMREFLGLGAPPDAAAVKAGEPLYQANCAACHGQNARGGEGPNLVRSAIVLHDTKGEEIGAVVKNGRPQAGMPAFPFLKPTEVYNIAEYLHQQVENAANRGLYGKCMRASGARRVETQSRARNSLRRIAPDVTRPAET